LLYDYISDIEKLVKDEYRSVLWENGGFSTVAYLQNHPLEEIIKYKDKIWLRAKTEYLRNKLNTAKPNIPVFIASDNNFVPLLAVAIYSILRNTKSHIDFYILDGGISTENKAKIETLKDCFSHFSLEFIAINVYTLFRDFRISDMITLSTYSRMLIPQLKPELDKAIYLDADIIAMDDIIGLWTEDLDNNPIGAVWATSNNSDAEHNDRLNLSKEHKYFNAGVLLINCKKWRQEHITENLFALEFKMRDKLLVVDQDLLNIYFDGKVKILPSKYNTTTRIVLFDRILKNDTDKIVVRHFESTEKPHNSHYYGIYRMPHFEEFWNYARLTPFLEMLPKNHKIQTTPDLSKFRKKVQKPPLVSVLIPTYNYAQYIGQCIESILAQNYPNIEIIVVDDGSTDDTAAVVQRIVETDNYPSLPTVIRYFYKENGGIGSAQNECLKYARGKYIAWADADDYWLAGKLQAQLKYFAEHPDCEIVFTLWEYNLENEKLKDNPLVQYEISLQQTNTVLFPSSLALKSVYDRCGSFNTEMKIGSDSEMLSKMIANNIKITNLIPVALYHRRIHSTNASFVYNKENPETKTLQYMIKNLRNKHSIAK
jgi:lipopolysaccharide biosynthesis glycosyltransferase